MRMMEIASVECRVKKHSGNFICSWLYYPLYSLPCVANVHNSFARVTCQLTSFKRKMEGIYVSDTDNIPKSTHPA